MAPVAVGEAQAPPDPPFLPPLLVEATHQVVLRGDLPLQRAPSGGRSEVEGRSGAPDLQVAEGAATPLGEAVVDWWLSLAVVMVGVGLSWCRRGRWPGARWCSSAQTIMRTTMTA